MELTKEVIEELQKKNLILLITKANFTYKGRILSSGSDYIRFKDKYDVERLILLDEIKVVEVLE